MGDIVREIHPHLLERLLPEQRPQQVDDHERDDEQHEHRGEDDAEQLAQQFPVGVFDLHPEKQLVIRGDARGEHLRVPYLRSILLRSDDRLLPFRPRCPRRQAVEPDFGNIAAVPAADHVDAVGQADAGIGQVTRQQGVVAGQVELEGRERRHMHLLINITGLVAAAQGDVRPHRVDLRPEGDHLADSSEVLYRDRTDHIRPHGVDIARRHDRRPGLRRPAPVTYQQVVVRRAVHGERHLARKLLRTVGIHPPQAPRLHEGQRQQGADRAERDISETVLIHGRGVYTAKIRIKTLLPPALTLFNTS